MWFKLLLLLFGCNVVLSMNFYRRDYTYDAERDTFYKLMEHGNSYESAFIACDAEDSKLFYPKDKEEYLIIRKLAEKVHKQNESILVGIRNEVGQYLTVDGNVPSIEVQPDIIMGSCVEMDIDSGVLRSTGCVQSTKILFACKKTDDAPCPTIDSGYQYNEVTKKCYKLNSFNKTWYDAMNTCFQEGGLLAVPETDQEINTINNIIRNTNPSNENMYYYMGYRKISNNIYSVRGKRMKNTFITDTTRSVELPPPSYDYVLNEDGIPEAVPAAVMPEPLYCGAIRVYNDRYNGYAGTFNSLVNCEKLNPFVCEMQPNI